MENVRAMGAEATGNGLEELPVELHTLIQMQYERQFLNKLADAAINPRLTSQLFVRFHLVFADICARWIENEKNKISKIAAFARILPLAPHLVVFLEEYLDLYRGDDGTSKFPFLNKFFENPIEVVELQQALLATWRLLYFDKCIFSRMIEINKIQALFKHKDVAVRYLAVRVFCQSILLADHKLEEMIKENVGEKKIIWGDFDGHSTDLFFLSLLEEGRFREATEKMRSLNKTTSSLSDYNLLDIKPQVTQYGSILLPRLKGVPSSSSSIVQVPTTNINMEKLAEALLSSSPILLHGLPGSGKTLLVKDFAREFGIESSMITLHLNEQTDVKVLIGVYTTGSNPGSFEWKPGVLTTAVKEGRWIFIEDIDRAPNDVLSVVLSLIERRELLIPNHGEVIRAGRGFRILASTQTALDLEGREKLPSLLSLGAHLWKYVPVQMPSNEELGQIILKRFPLLHNFLPGIIEVYSRLKSIPQRPLDISNLKNCYGRAVNPRDLLKWCRRLEGALLRNGSRTSSDPIDDRIRYEMFLEAIDCFAASLPNINTRRTVISLIAESMHIDPQQVDFFITSHVPKYDEQQKSLSVGRAYFTKNPNLRKNRFANTTRPFANTNFAKRLLEQIGVAVNYSEPTLLVGETGIGKTTIVQQLADSLGYKLVVVNLSQQSEVVDLLGSFKPTNIKFLAIPIKDEFNELFSLTGLSMTKNQKYLDLLDTCFEKGQWNKFLKLLYEAPKMFEKILLTMAKKQTEEFPINKLTEQPAKRRKTETRLQLLLNLKKRWENFSEFLERFDNQINQGPKCFAFTFVESNIIRAVRNGDWVLLDEINLASPDILESISDLLYTSSEGSRSILLPETGDIKRIKAHPHFKIFGAMNPATDVGKRDLPLSLRSRFTEIYVDNPDRSIDDLIDIVKVYIKGTLNDDEKAKYDIAKLYMKIIKLTHEKKLVDSANQVSHFSLRTLTRVLSYAEKMAPLYGLRRALSEGFAMGFLTFLDQESENILKLLIDSSLSGSQKNFKALLSQTPKYPDDGKRYVQFTNASRDRHYWLLQGLEPCQQQKNYIRTPSVDRNILNLVRAISTRQYPVLIQGPTSSGKTSMIEYLAKHSGNKCVRINNHEHTDLQEYLGSYVSTSDGNLHFQEGVLIQALRLGYWIILDELNLAPTDVLEALNRLLDDNREILIPETQEVVRPHDAFMLFATQNPPGHYGGRKVLSRAFRNRFLELHFNDIPEEELETILKTRCQNVAPSDCGRIVKVYKELSKLRQSSRFFEHKNSFATLRDLFRWANRTCDTREQLAANGYMLLAERVRNPEERNAVQAIIEKVMKVKIDTVGQLYNAAFSSEITLYNSTLNSQQIIWTNAMRRLYILVAHAVRNNEPILLVGETGCGKTTVCQMLAESFSKKLFTVNAHQNTETGDLIGAQRPIRNRAAVAENLVHALSKALSCLGKVVIDDNDFDSLLKSYQSLTEEEVNKIPAELHQTINSSRAKLNALFEWCDGGLIQAMREGQFFLLDEISLAGDATLERLNSVLETERTILLAEKGIEDSFIKATDGFQIFATMNPGGDYGKRELSPALRNRFTEIWVPPLSDQNDILAIVQSKLNIELKIFSTAMVQFAEWFAQKYRHSSMTSISIRDMLTWVNFMNKCGSYDVYFSLVQGAAMVYIDTLGANPAALFTDNSESIMEQRVKCLQQLGILLDCDILSLYFNPIQVIDDEREFRIGQFTLQKQSKLSTKLEYAFEAPTTKLNAMRVARALQVGKPILLEGNPGVGKTTLIAALALACNQSLTRINLSEHSDLMDLFGTDVPIDSAEICQFEWRDAPFLQAMQKGEWVLLDEMNLAPQSVLEGLNACLDHRGEVYISQLNKTFKRHPNFSIFAAQNPHHQGGGRKGLPSSFVNRFTVVYADIFSDKDLKIICKQRYPSISEDIINSIIFFVTKLEKEIVNNRTFGSQGGPWEFNLRDMLRWLQLLTSDEPLLKAAKPSDFIHTIFRQRFRSTKDCAEIDNLHTEMFPLTGLTRHLFHNLTPTGYQVGLAYLSRNMLDQPTAFPKLDFTSRLSELESVMICIQQNIPCLLVGLSGTGKTALLYHIAAITGNSLVSFSINSDTDTIDLIGGYEQADPLRAASILLEELENLMRQKILSNTLYQLPQEVFSLIHIIKNNEKLLTRNLLLDLAQKLSLIQSQSNIQDFGEFIQRLYTLSKNLGTQEGIRFEWVDGILVKALEQGEWLILDNANLCSASVLDRINSLLEPNGYLCMNERCGQDGQPRIVKPHPNFRIFMTMDPRFGELSRAMRNRALEIYLEPRSNIKVGNPCAVIAESSMYRFRNFILAMQHTNNMDINTIFSNAIENLSCSDLSIVRHFFSSFNYRRLGKFSSLAEAYISIYEDPGNEKLRNLIVEANNSFKKHSFKDALMVHPLQNSPFVPILAKSLGLNLILWQGAVFDFFLEIKAIQSAQSAQGEVLKYLKPSKMNRFQRSLIKKRITSVSGDSTINVSDFVEHHLKSLVVFLQNFSVSDREQFAVLKATIYSLLRFCHETVNLVTSPTFEEETFQAHLAIGEELMVSIKEKNPFLAENFMDDLERNFTRGFKLTTGLSMEIMWKMLRPIPISSSFTFKTLLKMEDLAMRFDEIRWKTSNTIFELGNFIKSFLKAYRLILTTKVDGTALVVSLTQEMASLEIYSTKEKESIMPHFKKQFETLRQYDFLKEMLSNLDEVIIDFDLLALSNYPSLLSLNFAISTPSSKFLQLVDFFWSENNDISPVRNSLLLQIIGKLNNFQDVKLNGLRLLETELPNLGHKLTLLSHFLYQDSLLNLNEVLLNLIQKIINILGDNSLQYWNNLQANFDNKNQSNTPDEVIISPHLRDVLTNNFLPSICHIKTAQFQNLSKIKSSALAWIEFAIGCIKLYVPNRAYDPDKRQRLELERHKNSKEILTQKLNSLRKFEQLFTGQDSNLRCQLLESDLRALGDAPEILQEIYRPESSEMTQLQGEFSRLLEVAFESKITVTIANDKGNYQNFHLLQGNINEIISRISLKYKSYRDLTRPIVCILRCLQIGLSLSMIVNYNPEIPAKTLLDLERMAPFMVFCDESVSEALLKSHPIEYLEIIATQTLCDDQSFFHSKTRQSTLRVINELYNEWRNQLDSDRLNSQVHGGLYRYRGSIEDEDEVDEEQFTELFPSYDEELLQKDNKILKSKASSNAIRIAKVHYEIFFGSVKPSERIKGLMRNILRSICPTLQNCCDYVSFNMTSVLLPGVLLLLDDKIKEHNLTEDPKLFNFYAHPNLPECRKLLILVHQIENRFRELQTVDEIKHMQPIDDVLISCSELLQYSHDDPLAKMITKVEKIHAYMHEWQFGGWVPKVYTALALYEEITSTIISWRRLELSTWAKLFEMEISKCEDDAKSWWFVAYEIIIAVPLQKSKSKDDIKDYAQRLLVELENYFSSAVLGQYSQRLKLLKQLQKHLEILEIEVPSLSIISRALANFISYYSRYVSKVTKELESGRSNLDKLMNDVLLMASWKDTNIVALRESAKRSHHKLFKIVRKFRELLGRPVEDILKQELPDEEIKLAITHNSLSTVYTSIDPTLFELCKTFIPKWSNKSKRLLNIPNTLTLMVNNAQTPLEAIDCSIHVENFLQTTVCSISALQKATPSVLSKENKEHVKNLKSQKRRLFADSLKSLRFMGIKYNFSSDILLRQGSLSTILTQLESCKDFANNGVDHHFHKFIDYIIKARNLTKQQSPDLTNAEISRSIGFLEGFLQVVISQHNYLSKTASILKKFKLNLQAMKNLWAQDYVIRKTLDFSNHDKVLQRLPHILRVGLEIIEIHSKFAKVDSETVHTSLESWITKFTTLKNQWDDLPYLPPKTITTKHFSLQYLINDATKQLATELTHLKAIHPNLSYIIDPIIPWTEITTKPDDPKSEDLSITNFDSCITKLSDSVLVAVENYKKEISSLPTSSEEQGWFIKSDNIARNGLKALHIETISNQILDSFVLISKLNLEDVQISKTVSARCAIAVPILNQYLSISLESFDRYVKMHQITCKTSYTLAKCFCQIATEGFCTPSEQSDNRDENTEKLEGGTGLGDGNGADDISKDVQEDLEDLEELAQEPNTSENNEIKDEPDAIDMADADMEGEVNDSEEARDDHDDKCSEDEHNEDQIDEESGSVDDLDPNAIDERMWDGESDPAEKNQQGDESKGSLDKDEVTAPEETNDKSQENKDQNDESCSEISQDEDIGNEQEDEVIQNDFEQHDPKADECEVLDLPDDMVLDGEDQNSISEDDDEIENQPDLEDPDVPDGISNIDESEEIMEEEGKKDEIGDSKDDASNFDMDHEKDEADEGEEGQEIEKAGRDNEEEDLLSHEKDDGLLCDDDNDNSGDVNQTNVSDEKGAGETINDHTSETLEAQSKSIGDNGSERQKETESSKQDQSNMRNTMNDIGGESKDATSTLESFKKLGDVLEKWHRQQIKTYDLPENKLDNNLNSDKETSDFQHLQDEDAIPDTQALGTTNEDQAYALDEAMAIDESNETPDQFPPDEIQEENNDQLNDMEIDELPYTEKHDHDNSLGRQVGATINQSKDFERKDASTNFNEETKEDEEEVHQLVNHIRLDTEDSLRPLKDAQKQWAHYEGLTRDLTLSLTEQLRLILAPTVATRMRGDFRTGKRLNIKRIIPYIASQYKRDKIWMRRSLPSKRSYQVMLAVDDSKSMGESGSGPLAFETLVMVSKSLSMLEVGEICIVGFGEDVKIAHDFDSSFSSDAGPKAFQHFRFQQNRTDIALLVKESINIFRTARAKTGHSAADLWQLEFIISDGICESRDHNDIKRLLREAMEDQIMIVFVIVDDVKHKKGGQSVMDLSQAAFVDGKVITSRYLDTFPFQYYIIVSDVRDLPNVLATLLRQWFQEVVQS
ncbi:Huge dynein-related AAA-type ATPase [Erysiphe neolycopersici]|uniref:Midasin n=1 Tax=Erysiphe neolycopersici TaxID=212602 RepID=A0A420HHL1_9PEZI|nr:Huge dynein-related AAA-type ATPase [Erysiphe neolycopersici]